MTNSWRTAANCRRADPTLFDEMTYTQTGKHSKTGVYPDRIQDALIYCTWCPVAAACLADALSSTDIVITGVRGGQYLSQKVASTARAASRKASGQPIRALSPTCPQGHEFDTANTHISKTGTRHCRACNRDRTAARRAAGLVKKAA